MPVDYLVLKKLESQALRGFNDVEEIAIELRAYLDEESTQESLRDRHVVGASSAGIQELILDKARTLGFQSEKKRLFSNYPVSALRPDYYRPFGETGILLEVERGKTIANNMDLLDLWKCHICPAAHYLFLIVPKIRPTAKGSSTRQFSHVAKRLAPFFDETNYVNVDAVFLFGY